MEMKKKSKLKIKHTWHLKLELSDRTQHILVFSYNRKKTFYKLSLYCFLSSVGWQVHRVKQQRLSRPGISFTLYFLKKNKQEIKP